LPVNFPLAEIQAAMAAGRYCIRRSDNQSGSGELLLLVLVEHPLNLIGIIRLGERQRKQQPRLPRL
jgi:hypothetical protein